VKRLLVVGCGGFLGAVARYGMNLAVAAFWTRPFPLATLLVNVSGCFLLGLLTTLAGGRLFLSPEWRLFLATGFVGAYTTFSTFEWETERLTEAGFAAWGLLNVVTSVGAGYAAVWLGMRLAR